MNGKTLRSPGLKMLALGALALLLLLPLAQVNGLIQERRERAREAEASVAAQWGSAQTLAPIYLVADIPTSLQLANGNFVAARATQVLLADTLDVQAAIDPEIRRRGMFEIPVYTTALRIGARFARADLAALAQLADADSRFALHVGLSDARGIRAVSRFEAGGRELRASAAQRELGGLQALGAAVPRETVLAGGDIEVALELTLAGTQRFDVLPLARTTTFGARGDWGDPNFAGAYLPVHREVRKGGFDASWQVLELNREYPQTFRLDALGTEALLASAFGVDLYQPANVYQQNERSGKYGMLVIALVFIALFLFETIEGLALHPIQYLLVGLALATFYLLLLALSEHVGFVRAYLVAATGAVLLIAGYARAVLGSWRRAATLATLQAAAYAVFYTLVRSEDYALLLGALTLFAALAALMYLTRRMDWYALGGRPTAALAPQAG